MRLTERPISSPKRDGRAQTTWERFFPYYAGFPETFANDVLTTLNLKTGATVLDPWNGSGTTTYAAVHRGYNALIGLALPCHRHIVRVPRRHTGNGIPDADASARAPGRAWD